MNCVSCGVEASFDSVDCIDGYDAGTPPRVVVDNGAICNEWCDQNFTCRACIAIAEAEDPEFDPTICVDCNAHCVAMMLAAERAA